jgi:hypothetical protein
MMIMTTVRAAAMEATAMPPFAPAESLPPEEDADWVLVGVVEAVELAVGVAEAVEFAVGVAEAVEFAVGVAEAVEFAVGVGKGTPLHVNPPLMLPLVYRCRKYSQSICVLL